MKTLKYYRLIYLILLTGFPLYGQEKIPFPGFLEKVNQLERAEKYDSARILVDDRMQQVEEEWFILSKEMFYIHEKTGTHEQNLPVFQAGHQRGLFYFMDERMPRFRPYLEMEGFVDLVKTDKELRAKRLTESETTWQAELPQKMEEGVSYPVLFVFHGGGSSATRAARNWQSPLLHKNYIRIFLQSYLYYDANTFGWRNSDPRIPEDLNRVFSEVIQKYPVDTNRIVLGGISAGASAATYSAFTCAFPVKAYIGICSSRPRDLDQEDLLHRKDIYPVLISGETDHYLKYQEELHEMYTEAGIQHSFTVIPGMGHAYPSDFPALLDRVLQEIENRQ